MARPEAAPVVVPVPLEVGSMAVPSRHMLVNGHPVELTPHADRAALAIRGFNDDVAQWEGAGAISGVTVRFGESLHPVYAGEKAAKDYKGPIYNPETQQLEVVVPDQEAKIGADPDKLLRFLEGRINDRIRTGFQEVNYLRRQMGRRHYKFLVGPALTGMLGEALGQAGSGDAIVGLATKGGAGALLGTLAGVGVGASGVAISEWLRFGWDAEAIMEYASQKAAKRAAKGKTPEYFKEPLITLSPLRPTP